MAEIAPAGGGPNRLFILLVGGLALVMVLGLGILGVVFLPGLLNPQPAAKATAIPTKITISTPTRAATLAATPTLVIVPLSATSTPTTEPSPTTAPPSPTIAPSPTPTGGQLPKSGLGEDLLLLAGGIILVAIVFLARRARTSAG
jgi:hypothetical protein